MGARRGKSGRGKDMEAAVVRIVCGKDWIVVGDQVALARGWWQHSL